MPSDGERIDQLLERGGLDAQKYWAAFVTINKSRLGKNDMLLKGFWYELPTESDLKTASQAKKTTGQSEAKSEAKERKYVVEPLFGKSHERVDIVDRKLKGATYYVVSGHGGPDPGATGTYQGKTVSEDEYAYDIMLRLARHLLSHGAAVHIIIQDPDDGIRDDAVLAMDDHETCMGEAIPLDQIQRLNQRCKAINGLYDKERKGYCRGVFLHVDSRSKKERIDIFFYHFMKSVKGQRLANSLRNKMVAKYKKHQPNRGFSGTVSERNLHVLRETNPPCVFLELGNMQNHEDLVRFVKSSNREAVARWICEGLIDDYKKEKK